MLETAELGAVYNNQSVIHKRRICLFNSRDDLRGPGEVMHHVRGSILTFRAKLFATSPLGGVLTQIGMTENRKYIDMQRRGQV
jgi:hypothetical protein